DNNELVGTCGYYRGFAENSGEIGYLLNSSYRGFGIMTEAIKLIVAFGFERLKLNTIIAYTNLSNPASLAVLKRVGFTKVNSDLADLKFELRQASQDHPLMTANDVVEIMQLFDENCIEIIVDGGWGVDALLGEQTRTHEDLDVAVQHKDVEIIRKLLEEKGFKEVLRDDTWECNFVLGLGFKYQVQPGND
ncbi:MAG: GNAT family N-acetyltransferase, partial [Deltaproteobacteria bacterium]|nr:GNAT family N-acetyltransferase [Deltaproteobacteria bacterium]